jgi:hypothetical protein
MAESVPRGSDLELHMHKRRTPPASARRLVTSPVLRGDLAHLPIVLLCDATRSPDHDEAVEDPSPSPPACRGTRTAPRTEAPLRHATTRSAARSPTAPASSGDERAGGGRH